MLKIFIKKIYSLFKTNSKTTINYKGNLQNGNFNIITINETSSNIKNRKQTIITIKQKFEYFFNNMESVLSFTNKNREDQLQRNKRQLKRETDYLIEKLNDDEQIEIENLRNILLTKDLNEILSSKDRILDKIDNILGDIF